MYNKYYDSLVRTKLFGSLKNRFHASSAADHGFISLFVLIWLCVLRGARTYVLQSSKSHYDFRDFHLSCYEICTCFEWVNATFLHHALKGKKTRELFCHAMGTPLLLSFWIGVIFFLDESNFRGIASCGVKITRLIFKSTCNPVTPSMKGVLGWKISSSK